MPGLRVPTVILAVVNAAAGVAVRPAHHGRGQRPGGRSAGLGVAGRRGLVRGAGAALLRAHADPRSGGPPPRPAPRPHRSGWRAGPPPVAAVGGPGPGPGPGVVDQPQHHLLPGADGRGARRPARSPGSRRGAAVARPRRGRRRRRRRGPPVARPPTWGRACPRLHDSDGFPETGTYLGRVWWFFTHGLPAEMGFRSVGNLAWIGGALGVAAYAAALVALGFALRAAIGARAPTGRRRRPTAAPRRRCVCLVPTPSSWR